MGKKKSHRKHSRSRSRSKSPTKRDKRSDSKDRHHSERRRHRSSSSDEYSHHQRSPEWASRSWERRHSHSRSNSRDGRYKRSKHRSHSRDRTRSRRDRNRSSERNSRPDSSHERIKDQRSKSPSATGSKIEKRDVTRDIPNFDSMTPSERIKAKIKLMLEKSSAGAADQPQVYTPTPSQLAGIESDTFESVSFSATRTSGQKEVEGSNNGTVPPTKTDLYNPAAIDPREYAPQVVELQETVSSYDSKGSSSSREEAEPPASWSGVTGVDKGSIHWNQNTIEVEEDKKSRWLQKLQTLQKKFRPPQ